MVPLFADWRYREGLLLSRVHYDRRASAYEDLNAFYRGAAQQVRTFCEENGIDCHIKKGAAD